MCEAACVGSVGNWRTMCQACVPAKVSLQEMVQRQSLCFFLEDTRNSDFCVKSPCFSNVADQLKIAS